MLENYVSLSGPKSPIDPIKYTHIEFSTIRKSTHIFTISSSNVAIYTIKNYISVFLISRSGGSAAKIEITKLANA